MIHYLHTPLTEEQLKPLKAGDEVRLSGVIYSARDAAHKRLLQMIDEGKDLPFDMEGAVIYYVGPTPNKPGEVIGAAGPTTSYRMDDMTEPLLRLGLKGTIGKGKRDGEIARLMGEHKAVYLIAIGGIGALMSASIRSSEIIAFEELGTEAVRKMTVEDMPLFVGIDSSGQDIYK